MKGESNCLVSNFEKSHCLFSVKAELVGIISRPSRFNQDIVLGSCLTTYFWFCEAAASRYIINLYLKEALLLVLKGNVFCL